MTNKSKKGGRPERYPDEESERVGFRSRPRYKKALELLANHRGTTLSESVELVISKFACEYEVDGKPLIDYVRPENEPFYRYFNAVNEDYFSNDQMKKAELGIQFTDYLEKALSTPPSMQKKNELFKLMVFERLDIVDVDLANVFDNNLLSAAIYEDWKEGRNMNDTCLLIVLASKAIQAKHIYLAAQGDSDVIYNGCGYVLVAIEEMNLLQKYLVFNDWNNYKAAFKLTEIKTL